jgi:hypothetical protein
MSLQKSLVKDVSPKALKKAVVAHSTQAPLTVYPAALSLLAGVYAILFDASSLAIAAMSIGGFLTAASWMWEYFVKGDSHASKVVAKYRSELESKRKAAISLLRDDLQENNDAQGLKQLSLFKEKYDNFLHILSRKLDDTELTHQRYMTIAEQVYLGGLDNLENAALALKSISAIDTGHIQKELNALDRQNSTKADSKRAALESRLALRKNQLDRASQFILENEQALTQLDHVATKIADIKTQQGRAQVDLEVAMRDLQHLITRAENYSN